nr:CD5 antigen-like [Biomphalaria glabrata]
MALQIWSVICFMWLSSLQVTAQPPTNISINIAAIKLSKPQQNQNVSSTNEGLVEVLLNGGGNVWGSICGANRSASEVNIICQMMGYQNGQQTLKGQFGVGSKNFLLENMTCPSNAISLDNCTHYLLKTCGPQDDELYVKCNPTPSGGGSPYRLFFNPSQPPGYPSLQIPQPKLFNQTLNHVCQSSSSSINIRLFSGTGNDTYGMGYVQLNINGNWVFVCQNSWNEAAAIVACREMCFSSLGAAQSFIPYAGIVRNYVPDPTNPQIQVSEVKCNGNENSIFNCSFDLSPGLCLQTAQPTLAGVQCLPQNNTKINIPFPDVRCGDNVLSADFPLSTFPYITPYNVDFLPAVPASCVNKTSNNTLFRISVSVSGSCNTVLKDNLTHITYENTIRYVWLNNNLRSYQYINQRYQLICSIPKTNVVTNKYQPYTLSPLNTIYGVYDFSLRLELYTSNTFQTPVVTIGGTYLVEVGDWINAAVVMQSTDTRLKVVTVECDALPVLPMAATAPVEKLIHVKCPAHPSLSMYEIDNFKQGFRFQAIIFSGYSMAYIRCTADVCLANSTSCVRMCVNANAVGRRRREAGDQSAQVSSSNILFYNAKTRDFQQLKSQLASDHEQQESTKNGESTPNEIQHKPEESPSNLQADELVFANSLGNGSPECLYLNSLLAGVSVMVFLIYV